MSNLRGFERFPILGDIWNDIGINNVFKEGGNDIKLRFGKKPEMLLERVIKIFTDEGDIVLDFFAGTGTTAAVAHKLKRRWLAIEQLDYIEELTIPRLKHVIEGEQSGISRAANWRGGGSFVFAELAASNSVFADRIKRASSVPQLKIIFTEMQETGYLRYNLNLSLFDEEDFATLTVHQAKCMMMDFLDANRLYVNIGSLGDLSYDISNTDSETTRSFYGITE